MASSDVADVLAGTYTIRITSTAGTYSDIVAHHDFTFVLTDPCANPAITVTGQTDPVEYMFTGSSPIAEFTVVQFDIIPAICI